MSQTYISVIVMILSQILPKLGFTIGSDELTTTISTIVLIGAGLWALIRRWQAGGVNFAGLRN